MLCMEGGVSLGLCIKDSRYDHPPSGGSVPNATEFHVGTSNLKTNILYFLEYFLWLLLISQCVPGCRYNLRVGTKQRLIQLILLYSYTQCASNSFGIN